MRDMITLSPDYIEHASVAGPISTIVLAEIARIEGDNANAVLLYDKAISLAQSIRFVQYEALAHHLLALHLQRVKVGIEKSPLAAHMMKVALKRYKKWGAWAVVRRLDIPKPSSSPTPSPRLLTRSSDVSKSRK